MADAPQYRREAGSPDQLPKGEAQQLNSDSQEALMQIEGMHEGAPDTGTPVADEPESEDAGMEEPEPGPVSKVPRGSVRAGAQMSDEEKLVFGPTSRPDEPLTYGGGGRMGNSSVPREIFPHLLGLAEMAKDPEAPSQIRTLARLLAANLGEDD